MRATSLKKTLLCAVIGACIAISLAVATTPKNSKVNPDSPEVFVWAWERPEKLDFIDAKKIGVAYLAETISLQGDEVNSRPRLQPLALPPDTAITAVVRVESHSAILSDTQLVSTVSRVSALAHLPSVSAVQIDFDATRSERDFYRALILKVREQLPAATRLSITALASWCLGDDWLSDLPIDEAVPMLFRMGVDRRQILSQLESAVSFKSRPCQLSAGVSTDEPLSFHLPRRRLYIFNPESWSSESLKTALEKYNR